MAKIMEIKRTIRRTIASAILTAGLAYPVCAAVCPKGIGGCTAPGRCFLFVDADGNSLCDYTARTGTAATSGSLPSRPVAAQAAPVQATAAPVPDPTGIPALPSSAALPQATQATPEPETTTNVIQSTGQVSTSSGVPFWAVITELALFFLITGIIFALIRCGIAGIRIEKPLPTLALSSIFGLGLSLMATSVITGGTIAGTTFALIFMGAGTLLSAYLWYVGAMTRRIAVAAGILGALTGFVFLAPIMPMELGGVVNVLTGTSTLTAGILVICIVTALALIVGRTFCGNICPVGSLQELAYAIPTGKISIRRTEILELVRLAVFVATVIAAVYLIDLMAFTGLYDLFALTLSAGFAIAAGLVLLSVFLYRPVCRILCPFGLLFSLFAEFSLFRLRRTEACISCRKCEKVCPTRSAGKDDSKRECYLCGRCTAACPKETALAYQR
jgi:polyferredoxin